ncbi:hypothetical protein U1Q18_034938 [Sarracenia purpurea var. burkii]
MGTLVGHIVPGLALVLLGLWHTTNTVRDYYLKGSISFVSSFWYPFKTRLSKLKNLELIFILSFSIFVIFLQVLDFPFFRVSFKLDNFEHATMFLHLAIFAGFTLCAELTQLSGTLFGVSGILAASVFGQELFLLHYHSADHVGLEGHYHWLLQLIVFVSLLAALSATISPTSFPAALGLGISVVFQGCWFMNMGFVLWVPEFIPKGCAPSMGAAVVCLTAEAGSRARALANMQFSWILAGIMIFMSCFCLKLGWNSRQRGQATEYEQLNGPDSVALSTFKQANP